MVEVEVEVQLQFLVDLRPREHCPYSVNGLHWTVMQLEEEVVVVSCHNKKDSCMKMLDMQIGHGVALQQQNCHSHNWEEIEQVHYYEIALREDNFVVSHQKMYNFAGFRQKKLSELGHQKMVLTLVEDTVHHMEVQIDLEEEHTWLNQEVGKRHMVEVQVVPKELESQHSHQGGQWDHPLHIAGMDRLRQPD